VLTRCNWLAGRLDGCVRNCIGINFVFHCAIVALLSGKSGENMLLTSELLGDFTSFSNDFLPVGL